MTEGPQAMREDFWEQVGTDGGDGETVPVRDRLAGELDAEQIHGIATTREQDDTIYLVVASTRTWDVVDEDVDMDIPVLDVRTAVVDLGADTVKLSENGLWVPHEDEVSEALVSLLARSTTDLNRGLDVDAGPALVSAVEGIETEDVLAREIEVEDDVDGQHVDKMESHGGIDPSRSWGYGAGPPPEVATTVERLREAGLDPSEHLSRLVWGKKEPMDRLTRPLDELTGNYGVELQPRESGLIALDVDYPGAFPESELPETFEVSSPHGTDERRHIVFRCDEKDAIAEEIGAWAVQSIDWGDLWVGDRYLVGPGSQLSEFGCDTDGHTRGERGGCDACEDAEGGCYRVVSDEPIATVSSDRILALLDESGFRDAEPRNGPADPDPPESDDDQDDEPDVPTCDSCGAARDPDTVKTVTVGDSERQICRGGCDE